MPKHEAWVRRDVAVRRATGTTRIEGAALDQRQVAELARRTQPAKLSEDEAANVNALETYEWIDYLSGQQDIPMDEFVIREINRHFLRGASEMLTPGVYRKGQNHIGSFLPPDQGDVPDLMRAFGLWLRQEPGDLNPVSRAAIAHLHFVAIHPFWDGNGRTARGLATLILQRSRFSFHKLLSLEYRFYERREAYQSVIAGAVGTRFSLTYDATPFVEFFAAELAGHVQDLVNSLTDWHRRIAELHGRLEREHAGLNPRQIDGLIYALQTGELRPADYKEITKASDVTCSRDLAGLVKAGLLAAEGRTRGRVYKVVRSQGKQRT